MTEQERREHFAFLNGVDADMKESRKEIIDLLEEIKAEMEHNVLDTLSDGGDDWYTAEKVNECLDIIDRHIKEYME